MVSENACADTSALAIACEVIVYTVPGRRSLTTTASSVLLLVLNTAASPGELLCIV